LTYTTLQVPNSVLTSAIGVNNNGDIVGNYEDQNGKVHGFLLSNGTGINNSRIIVGYYCVTANSLGFMATP